METKEKQDKIVFSGLTQFPLQHEDTICKAMPFSASLETHRSRIIREGERGGHP